MFTFCAMLKKDNARTIRSYCSYLGDLAETSRFRRCLQRIEGIVALLCNLRSEGNTHERIVATILCVHICTKIWDYSIPFVKRIKI